MTIWMAVLIPEFPNRGRKFPNRGWYKLGNKWMLFFTWENRNRNNLFLSEFFFHLHWRFPWNQGNEGSHLYFSLPLPPVRELSGTYVFF